MEFTDERTEDGVTRRSFTVDAAGERVPAVIWAPEGAKGPRPLVLMGHGGSQHKKTAGIVTRARQFAQRHGYATLAINAAIHTLTEERATDFGMLFCEPRNAALYEKLGWQTFDGTVYAEQPGGRAPFTAMAPYVFKIKRLLREGTIDLCGLPW